MRVWIDLANSPHVPLLTPVVRNLEERGDEVLLTVRDHAQTLALARRQWPEVRVVGGRSPSGRLRKLATIGARAAELRRVARAERPDVAFAHGSYAQVVAARVQRVPTVTMMDYEHQPANHLSFRLAASILVPEVFPETALRRFGAKPDRVVRYRGFKEQLYLADFEPDRVVLDELELDADKVIAVFRPPPAGALYHRMTNERFDDILAAARAQRDVQVVLVPRSHEQADRYGRGVRIAEAVDGPSLLACADVVVGAGGTMSRESAILGTPTYTVFAGELAAVDRELMRLGRLRDLRDPGTSVALVKKTASELLEPPMGPTSIRDTVVRTIQGAAS
jgi:predicted glycosyltransferase